MSKQAKKVIVAGATGNRDAIGIKSSAVLFKKRGFKLSNFIKVSSDHKVSKETSTRQHCISANKKRLDFSASWHAIIV